VLAPDRAELAAFGDFLRYLANSDDEQRDDHGKWTSGGGGEDLHVHATREQWSNRPNRESLSKRLGKTAIQIRERDGHKCQYCGAKDVHIPPARITDKHQLDHLIPRVEGGKDVATNLVTACKRCNSARHTMTVGEWQTYAKAKYGVRFDAKKVWKQAEKPLPEITKGKAA
jgi:5-methylcytosine-specific restriction endonuclease McrA